MEEMIKNFNVKLVSSNYGQSILDKFYEGIGLDGFETDSKGMIEYPESVKGYTKNSSWE